MQKPNSPTREGEAVECLLAGDTHGYSTVKRTRKPILGLPLSEEKLEQNLWRDVNLWDISRRIGGRVPDRQRLSKADASRMLGQALARLAKGGDL